MISFLQRVLTIAGILALQLPISQSTTGLPLVPSGHPASDRFSAWLAAFNTADEETLRRCLNDEEFPASIGSSRIRSWLLFARRTGGFDVVDVEDSLDLSSVAVLLKDRKHAAYARASMLVDISTPKSAVTDFRIRPIVTPLEFISKDDPRRPQWEKALKPLTPELRRAVVDGVVDVLRDHYVDQERVEEIIAGLKARSEIDGYDGFEESEKFAEHLMNELQELSHDHGIVVAFIEPSWINNDERHPMKHFDYLRERNFGFGAVSIDIDSLPGRTIATLPIHSFVPSTAKFASDWQEIRAAIGTVLSGIADADVLIVDLRSNPGGDPHTIAFILSYLLDGHQAVHLLDFVTRSGEIDESISTIPANELPSDTKRFGGTKPLYVLTNNETAYGGEDMAYSLQALKRAWAVIGERNEATVGGANTGNGPRFVCEDEFGHGWWLVAVPTSRPIHAITGTNWQGVGVMSDIVAGKGQWVEVHDAKEVGRMLATLDLGPNGSLLPDLGVFYVYRGNRPNGVVWFHISKMVISSDFDRSTLPNLPGATMGLVLRSWPLRKTSSRGVFFKRPFGHLGLLSWNITVDHLGMG